MAKFIFELAVQVTADMGAMFKLPCIYCLFKAPHEEGGVIYNLETEMLHPYQESLTRKGGYAKVGDWLCRDKDGKWLVLTNEEFCTEEFDEL